MRAAIVFLTLSTILVVARSKPVSDEESTEETATEGIRGEEKKGCEVGGVMFDDGAPIAMGESPCKVCACHDGTVECDAVRCEWRRDCTPKHRPGHCCPEFVHCAGDGEDSTISPSNEHFLSEEHLDLEEMSLPVVQLEQLDLVSTLSVNAGEVFTRDSAAVTESSVEAPMSQGDVEGREDAENEEEDEATEGPERLLDAPEETSEASTEDWDIGVTTEAPWGTAAPIEARTEEEELTWTTSTTEVVATTTTAPFEEEDEEEEQQEERTEEVVVGRVEAPTVAALQAQVLVQEVVAAPTAAPLLIAEAEVTSSRSAELLLRPLLAPPGADVVAPRRELMADLWHEALDILTGGRAVAARKAHNSKFIQRNAAD